MHRMTMTRDAEITKHTHRWFDIVIVAIASKGKSFSSSTSLLSVGLHRNTRVWKRCTRSTRIGDSSSLDSHAISLAGKNQARMLRLRSSAS
ncbi:hypothetical protein ACEPAF_8187 [Sanghuangporus sanghuang]